MGTSVYIGNASKDLICAPRPPSPPVTRVGSKESDLHKLEYGIPSSHTINTITLMLYLLAYGAGWTAYSSTLGEPPLQGSWLLAAAGLAAVWSTKIIFGETPVPHPRAACLTHPLRASGRLFLGMHSPIDLVTGFLVSACLTGAWIVGDAALEHAFHRHWAGEHTPPPSLLLPPFAADHGHLLRPVGPRQVRCSPSPPPSPACMPTPGPSTPPRPTGSLSTFAPPASAWCWARGSRPKLPSRTLPPPAVGRGSWSRWMSARPTALGGPLSAWWPVRIARPAPLSLSLPLSLTRACTRRSHALPARGALGL